MNSYKIAIIQNRLSTQNKKNSDWLESIISEYNWIKLFPTSSSIDINKAVIETKKLQIPTIVIDGGDGTIGLVISSLFNNYKNQTFPSIALISSGKTNMTAQSWGIQGSRELVLSTLIKKQLNGQLDNSFHPETIVKVSREGKSDIYGTFFGTANIVDSILFCRKYIYPFGFPNWLSHSLAFFVFIQKAFFGSKKENIIHAIEIDDKKNKIWSETGNFFVLIATSLSKLLFSLKPEIINKVDSISYLAIKQKMLSIISLLPIMVHKKIRNEKFRNIVKPNSICIKSINYFTLDGEIYETNKNEVITISATHKLNFIR